MSKINIDILNTLSNLSSDEVFTSPEIANRILDLLPSQLFESEKTTFLDPCSKSGIFLREIVKRLNKGLKSKIPNTLERINHILGKQVFGISTTELCHLMTKRTLYCSKYANRQYSIGENYFSNDDGNIYYDHSNHFFDSSGRCKICGVSAKTLLERASTEQYAYSFIHQDINEIQRRYKGMQFDVIIGNPPYQMDDGGAQASSKPIYNLFIDQALKLKPKYACFIIPSRWMIGGKGLDDFRKKMIEDKHIKILHDFLDSKECFPNNDIKGGVCYFLRDEFYEGKTHIYTHTSNGIRESFRFLKEEGCDIYIRDQMLIDIMNKVNPLKGKTIDKIVSSRKPYGLEAETMVNQKKFNLPPFSSTPIEDGYKIFGLGEGLKRMYKYLPKNYPIPKISPCFNKYKVFIAEAYGCGAIGEVPSTPVLSTPVLSTPGELCTETFLEIGPFDTEIEALNMIKYIKTKFFRTLVGIQKQTQHTTQKVYRFVPMQNFTNTSDVDWNKETKTIDQYLYKKYNLSEDEITFIETNVKEME